MAPNSTNEVVIVVVGIINAAFGAAGFSGSGCRADCVTAIFGAGFGFALGSGGRAGHTSSWLNTSL
jgi:hypothetical protein